MYAAWLANEHSRIHLIEQWPDGPRKEVALAAARSALDSLLGRAHSDASAFHCVVCANRLNNPVIVGSPKRFELIRSSDLAA
jgi:hypothetical protein